jgi:hypothetical protein
MPAMRGIRSRNKLKQGQIMDRENLLNRPIMAERQMGSIVATLMHR